MQAGQQRVVLLGEIDAEQRREQAAQAEMLEQHDLTATHATAGGKVEGEAQAAASAVPTRQRRCRAQPLAPPLRRHHRFERHPIQPASQSRLASGTTAGVVSRCALAMRSSRGVRTPSKLARKRERKSARVARGR